MTAQLLPPASGIPGAALPPEWIAGLARLAGMPCPRAISTPPLWDVVIRASNWLYASDTLATAHALGWDTLDLWGCDPAKPAQRYDVQGLVWCMAASTIGQISAGHAFIVRNTGSQLRYTRTPPDQRRGTIVPAWELPL